MKATINVTDTMLNKSIIDANKSVCELAKEFSFDYSEHEAGDKNMVSCRYPDGIIGRVTFYKAKTRGDKRISITKLKHYRATHVRARWSSERMLQVEALPHVAPGRLLIGHRAA